VTLTITSHYWSSITGLSNTAGCAKRNLQGCLAASVRRSEVEVVLRHR
jgi:hypothetical protein